MLRPLTVVLFAAVLVCPLSAQDGPKGKNWQGKDLQKRDLRGVDLENANLSECNLFLADMREVNAKGAIFKDADLSSASLDGADLTGADFRGATLHSATFQRAKLQKANFEKCDLSKTSLQSADLRGANLKNVKAFLDITRADFRGADLRGANLLGAKDYTGSTAKFTGAKYDKSTRWHQGFDVESSGAVLAAADDPKEPAPRPKTGTTPKVEEPGDEPANPKKQPAAEKPLDPNRPKDAPPEKEVKAQLEKHMWGPPMQGGTKHTYNYKSMKFGEPLKGTLGNKPVTYYPLKVEVEVTRTFTDGSSKMDVKKQTYQFYKDEFGEWTFKFIQND